MDAPEARHERVEPRDRIVDPVLGLELRRERIVGRQLLGHGLRQLR